MSNHELVFAQKPPPSSRPTIPKKHCIKQHNNANANPNAFGNQAPSTMTQHRQRSLPPSPPAFVFTALFVFSQLASVTVVATCGEVCHAQKNAATSECTSASCNVRTCRLPTGADGWKCFQVAPSFIPPVIRPLRRITPPNGRCSQRCYRVRSRAFGVCRYRKQPVPGCEIRPCVVNADTGRVGFVCEPIPKASSVKLTSDLHPGIDNLAVILAYSWGSRQEKLNTATSFLGGVVGSACGGSAAHLIWGGENRERGGFDGSLALIGLSRHQGAWEKEVTISFHADWADGFQRGSVSLQMELIEPDVQVMVPNSQLVTPIRPGVLSGCSSTQVASLTVRVDDSGSITLALSVP